MKSLREPKLVLLPPLSLQSASLVSKPISHAVSSLAASLWATLLALAFLFGMLYSATTLGAQVLFPAAAMATPQDASWLFNRMEAAEALAPWEHEFWMLEFNTLKGAPQGSVTVEQAKAILAGLKQRDPYGLKPFNIK